MSSTRRRTGDSTVQSLVLEFIKKRNKPVGAKVILDNLQKSDETIKKDAVERSLEHLVAKKEAFTKTFKKAVVYWPNQDNVSIPSEEELALVDQRIQQLEAEVKDLNGQVANLDKETARLNAEPTDEELDAEIAKYQKDNAELNKRLDGITSGKKLVTKQDKMKVEKAIEVAKDTWKKRKRIFTEICGQMEEGMGAKKFKNAKEDMGIETDEQAGVSLNSSVSSATNSSTKSE